MRLDVDQRAGTLTLNLLDEVGAERRAIGELSDPSHLPRVTKGSASSFFSFSPVGEAKDEEFELRRSCAR